MVVEAAAADLVAALSELQNAPKDGKADTGKFSYGYASLPAILDLIRPVLARHGLGVTQETVTDGAFVGVNTRLHHRSGETFVFGPLFLPAGQNAQTAGSAITYARRYALTAALGISADEDDDGKKASAPPTAQAGKESPPSLRTPGAEGAASGATPSDAGSTGTDAAPTSSAAPDGAGTEAEGARQDLAGVGEGPAGTEGSPQPPTRHDQLWKQLVQFAGTKRKALNAVNETMKASWTEGHISDIPDDDIEHTILTRLQKEGAA